MKTPGCVALLVLVLSDCALPGIHREAADGDGASRDAAVGDSGKPATTGTSSSSTADEDAGPPPDPRSDPANLNEDYATFRSLVPEYHMFAEWPMPDTSEYSKAKPSYTVSGPVIVDNVTKLRWQAKMPTIYPGCKANYEFVGRLRGVGTGCSWEEAKAYCASPEVTAELGEGEWRVPTKIELETLIDVNRVNAVSALFDDFPIDSVWSSSPFPNTLVDGLKMSWQVDMMDGSTGGRGRTKASRVRCVSSPNPTGGSVHALDFVGDVARDANTLLEWQRYPDSATRNWRDARAYCEQLDLDGGGWHLPSLKELLTIVDATRHEPALHMRTFDTHQTASFWTSSVYLDSRSSAYMVEFSKGGSSLSDTFEELHYARCAR
jgi:hypothetical protein